MGADTEVQDQYGNCPLHIASMNGCPEIVQMLLEVGANVEAKDADGNSPLHLSCMSQDSAISLMLVERGASLKAKDNVRALLHFMHCIIFVCTVADNVCL